MEILVKMEFGHCPITGLFATTREKLQTIIGKRAQFDAYIVELSEDNFSEVTNDEDVISTLIDLFGDETMVGYNPFECLEEGLDLTDEYDFEYDYDEDL